MRLRRPGRASGLGSRAGTAKGAPPGEDRPAPSAPSARPRPVAAGRRAPPTSPAGRGSRPARPFGRVEPPPPPPVPAAREGRRPRRAEPRGVGGAALGERRGGEGTGRAPRRGSGRGGRGAGSGPAPEKAAKKGRLGARPPRPGPPLARRRPTSGGARRRKPRAGPVRRGRGGGAASGPRASTPAPARAERPDKRPSGTGLPCLAEPRALHLSRGRQRGTWVGLRLGPGTGTPRGDRAFSGGPALVEVRRRGLLLLLPCHESNPLGLGAAP